MSSIEDIWSELNHTHVQARFRLKEIKLEKRAEKALRTVIKRRVEHGFVGPTSYEILQIISKYLESSASAVSKVYQEVWTQQGREITPEFLRAVSLNAIDSAVNGQVEKWLPVLEELIPRFRIKASLAEMTERLRSEARRIQDDYRSRLEVSATKMEYKNKRVQAEPIVEDFSKRLDESFPSKCAAASETIPQGGTGESRELEPEKKERDRWLPAAPDTATVDQAMGLHASSGAHSATERRAAVDAYIDEVLKKTGKRITRTDIWKAAHYRSRTEFERWERKDSKRPNKTANRNFSRILAEKSHLK